VPISVQLKRIIINEIDDDQVIVLQETEGERSLPILVGLFEATSIDRRVKGLSSPRPLTHDLIVKTIEALGGEIHDIIISELKNSTYYGLLRVRLDGELHEIDCRPSDAVAVAVTAGVPMYVNEAVFGDGDPF
jgi:bifunctional DNase/RNase